MCLGHHGLITIHLELDVSCGFSWWAWPVLFVVDDTRKIQDDDNTEWQESHR